MSQTNILLETGTNELEVVEFILTVNNEKRRFCINVAKVREVIMYPLDVVTIPESNDALVGSANIRQNIVPIVDLARWLGINKELNRDYSKCKVIMTYFNYCYSGFIVDEVVRIHRITWENIKSYTDVTDIVNADSVTGVVRLNDNNYIQMLDFENIIFDLEPENGMATATIDETITAQRHGKVVYICDDSNVIRSKITQNLERAGYTVYAFNNGYDLFDKLDHAFPNVIVTDLEMPKISGDFIVRSIRERQKFDEVPIIVFSSMISEENHRKLRKVGANEFLGKPELTGLVKLIDKYVIYKNGQDWDRSIKRNLVT